MRAIHILLVEDNEGDILLITEALEEAKVLNSLSVVRDGDEAIRYLTKEKDYTDARTPDLILLDINLPKRNGQEVLQFIKNTEKLKQIPVIILTTSSSPMDINASYDNQANCYVSKPVEVCDFLRVINTIESFWINIVHLPSPKK
jgi:CheY-like chemotaxis protein